MTKEEKIRNEQIVLLEEGLALFKKHIEENETMLGEDAAVFTKRINEIKKTAREDINQALIEADKVGGELEQYPLRKSLALAKQAMESQMKDEKYANEKAFFQKWEKLLNQAEEYLDNGDTGKAAMILDNYFQEKLRNGLWRPISLILI